MPSPVSKTVVRSHPAGASWVVRLVCVLILLVVFTVFLGGFYWSSLSLVVPARAHQSKRLDIDSMKEEDTQESPWIVAAPMETDLEHGRVPQTVAPNRTLLASPPPLQAEDGAHRKLCTNAGSPPSNDCTPPPMHQEAERVFAVGSYTSEQITLGCLQLSEAISMAAAWHRHLVLPRVMQGHLVGMAGHQELQLFNVTAQTPQLALKSYFNLTYVRRTMQKESVGFIGEHVARKRCEKKWTLVYVAHNWNYPPYACGKDEEHHERTSEFWKSLRSTPSNDSVVIAKSCEWLVPCLPPKIQALAPFRRVVCAAVPEHAKVKPDFVEIGEKLFGDDPCVLLAHFFGSSRHRARGPPTMLILPFQFVPSPPLQSLVGKIASKLNVISKPFISVHVRAEYLEVSCNFTRNCPTYEVIFKNGMACFDTLKAELSSVVNGSTVVFSWDRYSDSKQRRGKHMFDDSVAELEEYLEQRFKKHCLMDIFELLEPKDRLYLHADLGRKAIVDTAVLAAADRLYVLGGGSFQSSLLARHAIKLQSSMSDIGVCFSPAHGYFPISVRRKGRLVSYIKRR